MDIKLKRQAGEKRQQAAERLKAFKERLIRQTEGKLAEGESQWTHEEINAEREAIEDIVAEAKALEGVNDLDDVFSRPEGEMSAKANILRELFNAAREGASGKTTDRGPFSKLGEFIRAVRSTNGQWEGYAPVTEEQFKYLRYLHQGAGPFVGSAGEVPTKEFKLGEGGERAHKALVGDDTGSAGRGDYLVPTEHMAELLRAMGEQQQFANRARRVPMTRRTLDFPRLAQSTAADTRPMYSFAAVTKIAEGAQKPEREPTFEQLTLTAIKYAAYLEASDELLSDSIVDLPPVLVSLLTEAIAYEFDRDTMRGGGTTEPQGFIGHASEWTQNRASANTVGLGDVLGLEERFFGTNGIYLHHPSVLPKLGALAQSNVIFWNRDISSSLPGTLVGRPMVRTHKLPVLGTKGDICLVDPQFYLVGDLQRITVASSIHAQFRNDVTAWRAIFRAAGTPWPAGLFSHEASGGLMTYRVSPFCVLDVVATS